MKHDTIMMIAFMAVLLFLSISLLINTSKSCDVYIDYDVTADANTSKTVLNIAEIKLACYKLCAEELRNSDTQQNRCFDRCEKLE